MFGCKIEMDAPVASGETAGLTFNLYLLCPKVRTTGFALLPELPHRQSLAP